MKFKKILILILITGLTLTFFTGISCKEEEAPEEEAVEEEAVMDNSEIKLAVYWGAVEEYFPNVELGIEQFTEKYGIPVTVKIGTAWTIDEAVLHVEGLVAQGYNGIMSYPVDYTGINELYKDVVAQGVFVCNYASSSEIPTPASFSVATDVKQAAMDACELLIASMGEKGNIANVIGLLEDPNQRLRKEGIEEVVAKYPDVEIIQTIERVGSIQEAIEQIGNAVGAFGEDLNGVITSTYPNSVGLAQIMTELGDKRIKAVGIDNDPSVLKAIEEGYLEGTFAQNPYMQGYITPMFLMYLLQGKESKGYEFVDTGGVMVTKDNLDTINDELWANAFAAGDEVLSKYFK